MGIDIDWAKAWVELQAQRGEPADSEFWDGRASGFAASCGTSAYSQAFLDLAKVAPGETVFDMGCGSGALTIPLAKAGHEVWAADFSPKMLEALEKLAAEAGVLDRVHPVLLDWDSDWRGSGVPVCDVAFASRSISTSDMQASLKKLDTHALRRCCITLTTGYSPRADPVIVRVLGRELPQYPDCIFAFNMLWQMGIHAEVSYINSLKHDEYESFDEAVDRISDAYKATPEERDRLVAYAKEHLSRIDDASGASRYEFDHARVTSWMFLAWNKHGQPPV